MIDIGKLTAIPSALTNLQIFLYEMSVICELEASGMILGLSKLKYTSTRKSGNEIHSVSTVDPGMNIHS